MTNKDEIAEPRFAVLFKTHFWDEFCDRQLHRLRSRAGCGDVYVVVDETKRPVPGIGHDRIIRMTEETSAGEGYLRYPAGNMFWYNTDYQIYHFIDCFPEYDYIVICEYDCTVDTDISDIVRSMAVRGLGFVGERIRTQPAVWGWTPQARPYYDDGTEISGRLVCFAAFSRTFASQLQEARREHTRRVLGLDGKTPAPDTILWPNNEAFIGTEIKRLSVREATLSEYGDTSHYDWNLPYLEIEIPNLPQGGFIHPLLDGPKYIRSMTYKNYGLHDLFIEGTPLHARMGRCRLEDVIRTFLPHFLQNRLWDQVEKLRKYAHAREGDESRRLFNIARGKHASQSSVCRWSRFSTPTRDAAGAVSGEITGDAGFHTDLEDSPWWCVDLDGVCPIREIVIYNRMGQRSRARGLIVSCSIDMIYWRVLYRHAANKDFGGTDGNPLVIELAEPVEARFLRIHLPTRQILHLDQVEVYL